MRNTEAGDWRKASLLLVQYRVPSLEGLALVLWSFSLYVSCENRPVLGRWSYEFAGVFLFLTLAWIGYLWYAVRRGKSPITKSTARRVALTLFNLGMLAWGTAYLLSALDARSNAARLLDGNLVGSSAPLAAVLEWLTMVAFLGVAMNMVIEHRHARWINLTLPLLSVATLLTLAEGGARLRAIILPATQGFPTYSGDLWTRRFVHLNQLGFRDTDHVAGRRDGARRLLVVGDSYAFGAGIRRTADRFGERLVIGLTSASGETWQSVNASRGDSHTLDEIEFLRRSLPYEPDVVILLYVFNDIDYLRPVTVRTV
ncbi:MAG: SGNH/GDSL hydrolase family protein, partial [Planctomycetes bacterium]|nr:SGNH/GDSL hydrolase family protein [Planctomycetota bacterium]